MSPPAAIAALPRPGSTVMAPELSRAALAPLSVALPMLAPFRPAPSCTPDEHRIRNYAARIAAAVGLEAGDDLTLFDAEGRPLPNLHAVMLAMSGFELGLLRAGSDLVAGAVERLAQRQMAEAAKAVPLP